jgi:S1-C subfamily serine protease
MRLTWKQRLLGLALSALLVSCSTANRYERAQKSTVLIQSSSGYGSGFVVQRGHRLFVWTANHVVERDNELKIRCIIRNENHKVGESSFTAKVIARDAYFDLALLWLDAPVSYFTPVEFAPWYIRVGDPVYHCGNFLGPSFNGSVSTGVLSQIGVDPYGRYQDWPWSGPLDQTTCIVVPGSSGGPLWNSHDEIVGVVVGHVSAGVEFFVPLRAMHAFAKLYHVQFAVLDQAAPKDESLNALVRLAFIQPQKPSIDFDPETGHYSQ